MKEAYPVLFTKTAQEILVEVPDLEILTQGKTFPDAIEMARDAIGLKVVTLEDEKQAVPSPSSHIDVEKGEFSLEGETILSFVDVDFQAYRRSLSRKMVRRNISLPSWLDAEAKKAKVNVSKVLQDALKEKLQLHH